MTEPLSRERRAEIHHFVVLGINTDNDYARMADPHEWLYAIKDLFDEVERLEELTNEAKGELVQARATLQRVRRIAAHPHNTQGYIRNFVYAADILATLDLEEPS